MNQLDELDEFKELKSINGNKFLFRTQKSETISVLSAGYIITPDGHFVNVKDHEDHGDIFSQYLSKYLEEYISLQSMEAATRLTELDHIVYYGIKVNDMKYIYGNQRSSTSGFGVLIFPNDLTHVSVEQKKACIDLIETNKSIFGYGERIELKFHQIIQEKEIKKETILKFLENKNKQL